MANRLFPILALLFLSRSPATEEALHFIIASKDTVTLLADYDLFPETPPPQGEWIDGEKDSAWIDADGGSKHVRYQHAFRVTRQGKSGAGFDYIHYNSVHGGAPQYSANLSFNWSEGRNYESWVVDGQHYRDNPDLEPPLHQGLKPGEAYFTIARTVNGQSQPMLTARLLSRENGSGEPPIAVGPRSLAPRADPGAGAALRVFDLRGRQIRPGALGALRFFNP